MSHEPNDKDHDIADRNIEQLLGKAYQPEEPDPDWAMSVRSSLDAAAARRRAADGGRLVDEHGMVYGWPPRMTLYVGWAAAAMLLIGLLFTLHSKPTATPLTSKGQTDDGKGQPVAVQSTKSMVAMAALDATVNRPRWLSALRRPDPPAVVATQPGQTLKTGPRERQRVKLADGSVVFLNENTTLRTLADRHVALDRGEIYLDVAPKITRHAEDDRNRNGTFVVETPQRRLTALGTKFAVTVAGKRTDVAVVQGRVRTDEKSKPIGAGQQTSLSPGDETNEAQFEPAPRLAETLYWTRDLMAAAEPVLVPASSYSGGAVTVKSTDGAEVPLSLRRYHVDVHIEDGFARTTIDQTYFNHLTRREEGTFHFPLPPDASISRLAMYVNGRLMEGGMVERNEGRNVFESIKYRMQDPALLEWIDGTTFKMRVFPLEPRQEKRIILSYTQPLETLGAQSRYRFPIGHSLGDTGQFSAHMRIRGGSAMDWNCATHSLVATHNGADLELDYSSTGQGATAGLPSSAPPMPAHSGQTSSNMLSAFALSGDLEVTLKENSAASSATPRFSSFVHEGFRYLMLRTTPELTGSLRPQRRDWIFVIESSADRSPLVARAQIEIVRGILNAASHDDTLAIVAAGTLPTVLQPLGNTPANIESACEQLDQVHLIGALDLEAALHAAGTLAKDATAPVVVHIGSGVPALGERSDNKLAAIVPANAQYVGVAVGRAFNRNLMKLAAAGHRGYFTQINPNEPLTWRATDLVTTLNSPRLLEVRAHNTSLPAREGSRESWLTTSDALTRGERFFAMTRIPAGQPFPKSVTISGQLDGKLWNQEFPVQAVAENAGYLPRQWARLEIDRLLAADGAKNREEIVKLSKAMYVMSPYTSLLVLENEEMYAQYKVDRGRKDHWAMYPAPAEIPVVTEAVVTDAVPLTGDINRRREIVRRLAEKVGAGDAKTAQAKQQLLVDFLLQLRKEIIQKRTTLLQKERELSDFRQTNGSEHPPKGNSLPDLVSRQLAQMKDMQSELDVLRTETKEMESEFTKYSKDIDDLGTSSAELDLRNEDLSDVEPFRRPIDKLQGTIVVRPGNPDGANSSFYNGSSWQPGFTPVPGRGGAVGFQPQISMLTDGVSASGVISSGRRYVQITALPFFSQVGPVTESSTTTGGSTTTTAGTTMRASATLALLPFLGADNNVDLNGNGIIDPLPRAIAIDNSRSMLSTENVDLGEWLDGVIGFNVRVWDPMAPILPGDKDDALAFTNYTGALQNTPDYDAALWTNAASSGGVGLIRYPLGYATNLGRPETDLGYFEILEGIRRDDQPTSQHFPQRYRNVVEQYFTPLNDPPIAYPSPEMWQELTIRRRKYTSVDLQQRGPAERKIFEQLTKKTRMEFDEARLDEVVGYLQELHGITIALDKSALEAINVTGEHPVTISIQGTSLRSGLQQLMRQLDPTLTMQVQDEVLMITTKEAATDHLLTKVYPVGDLVSPYTGFLQQGFTTGTNSYTLVRPQIPYLADIPYVGSLFRHASPQASGLGMILPRIIIQEEEERLGLWDVDNDGDGRFDSIWVDSDKSSMNSRLELIERLARHTNPAGIKTVRARQELLLDFQLQQLEERELLLDRFKEMALADLLAYAPGMSTNALDIQAVIESEGSEPLPKAGHIDPKAAELIAKARAAGWRAVELKAGRTVDAPGDSALPLTVRFDGTGRFQYERATVDGLKETVLCDGTNLWHAYPELGVAAQRKFSRVYRGALCQMVPWLLPPVEDLAVGNDITLIDNRTVAIRRAGGVSPPLSPRQETGGLRPPLAGKRYLQLRLVFAESGQLEQQQLVDMPAGKVLGSVRFTPDGAISLHNRDGKELSRRTLKLAAAGAPDLSPPSSSLVIVPLPLRTQAEIAAKTGVKADSDPATWDEATAIATAAVADGPTARKIIQKRFFARGDFRLGFYTLLLRHSGEINLSGQPGGKDEKCVRHPLAVDPRSPLARYIADRIGNDATTRPADAQPALGDGLLAQLDQYGALVTPLSRYDNLKSDEQKAQLEILRRSSCEFVQKAYSPRLALHVGLLAEAALKDREVHLALADFWERMGKHSSARFGVQYEKARQVLRAGQIDAARKEFLGYHGAVLEAGFLPPIDREFYEAVVRNENGRSPERWQKLIDETVATLRKRGAEATLIPLAWQCRLLREEAQADRLVEQALQVKDDKLERQQLTQLLAADYYHRTRQLNKADALVMKVIDSRSALLRRTSPPVRHSAMIAANERFSPAGETYLARLWHWAAQIAQQRGRFAESASREHQVLDLIYATPPEKIDLNQLRINFGTLMNRYEKAVEASAVVGQEPPRELVAAIMAAADQWRNLDDTPEAACQRAAKLLRTLGAKDPAWQYLTTPLAGKAHESGPWVSMASQLASDGELDLAEFSYRAAAQSEPTNPEILLTHANLLRDNDRTDSARQLYQQVVSGTWQQPRFNGVQQQARQALDSLSTKK